MGYLTFKRLHARRAAEKAGAPLPPSTATTIHDRVDHTPLPQSFPGRELWIHHGFTTVESITRSPVAPEYFLSRHPTRPGITKLVASMMAAAEELRANAREA